MVTVNDPIRPATGAASPSVAVMAGISGATGGPGQDGVGGNGASVVGTGVIDGSKAAGDAATGDDDGEPLYGAAPQPAMSATASSSANASPVARDPCRSFTSW